MNNDNLDQLVADQSPVQVPELNGHDIKTAGQARGIPDRLIGSRVSSRHSYQLPRGRVEGGLEGQAEGGIGNQGGRSASRRDQVGLRNHRADSGIGVVVQQRHALDDIGIPALSVHRMSRDKILTALKNGSCVALPIPNHRRSVAECDGNYGGRAGGRRPLGWLYHRVGQGHRGNGSQPRIIHEGIKMADHLTRLVIDKNGGFVEGPAHDRLLGRGNHGPEIVHVVDLDVINPVGGGITAVIKAVPGSNQVSQIVNVNFPRRPIQGGDDIGSFQGDVVDGLGELLDQYLSHQLAGFVINADPNRELSGDGYRRAGGNRGGHPIGHCGGAIIQHFPIGEKIAHLGLIGKVIGSGRQGRGKAPAQYGGGRVINGSGSWGA